MTERPIAYTRENILAILEGRKRMTRRVVAGAADGAWLPPGAWIELQDGKWMAGNNGVVWELKCPYGKVDDLLWVREGWRTGIGLDPHNATEITKRAREAGWTNPWAPVRFEADGKTENWDVIDTFGGKPGRLRAARFMPRWASRIDQVLVSVKVERLQAITEEDALAEGCCTRTYRDGRGHEPAVLDFRRLWDSINGERSGCSWDDSPFVWVLETGTL